MEKPGDKGSVVRELGDVALPVYCPRCSKRAFEKIARLEQDPIVVCSGCETSIDASPILSDAMRYFAVLRGSFKGK